VVDAEVEGAGERVTHRVRRGVEDTELVVLVRPLHLLVEPERDLRLLRGDRLRAERDRRRRLLGALRDVLRARQRVERHHGGVTELQRLRAGELGDGAAGRGLLPDAGGDVLRERDPATGENGHDWPLSWVC
jgi:hypothetical protein